MLVKNPSLLPPPPTKKKLSWISFILLSFLSHKKLPQIKSFRCKNNIFWFYNNLPFPFFNKSRINALKTVFLNNSLGFCNIVIRQKNCVIHSHVISIIYFIIRKACVFLYKYKNFLGIKNLFNNIRKILTGSHNFSQPMAGDIGNVMDIHSVV